jgi:hypothetical protein
MAIKHIEEAKQLTAELGGTDQDVKQYFFSLPEAELDAVMNEYGRIHGLEKREYAIETFERWKAGTRQMSGMVASRLFSLLPPRMPLIKKYELVENLWRHLAPKTRKVYTVGYETPPQIVVDTATQHLLRTVQDFRLPEALERRFEWLSAGDVNVKQQLLNHLQNMERDTILEGARIQVPVLTQHLKSNEGVNTNFVAQEISLGNHVVRLEFRRDHQGITEGAIRPATGDRMSNQGAGIPIWVYVAAAIVVLFLISR